MVLWCWCCVVSEEAATNFRFQGWFRVLLVMADDVGGVVRATMLSSPTPTQNNNIRCVQLTTRFTKYGRKKMSAGA